MHLKQMTGELIWGISLYLLSDVAVICQWDMFVNQMCLTQEWWYYLGYLCPGVNKPVSLATGSYVIDNRVEGWWHCRFMVASATLVKETSGTRQHRCSWWIGFVCVVYNYPTRRQTLENVRGQTSQHRNMADKLNKCNDTVLLIDCPKRTGHTPYDINHRLELVK